MDSNEPEPAPEPPREFEYEVLFLKPDKELDTRRVTAKNRQAAKEFVKENNKVKKILRVRLMGFAP